MASFNKVILAGNLTRDPELRYTQSGQAVSTLGLAVNNHFKDKEDTLFIDVNVWGKVAENCAEYLKKGSPVLIEGKLNCRTYESKDGQKRSKVDVTALSVQFLSGGQGGREPDREPNHDDVQGDDLPF